MGSVVSTYGARDSGSLYWIEQKKNKVKEKKVVDLELRRRIPDFFSVFHPTLDRPMLLSSSSTPDILADIGSIAYFL